ncbi:MAG: hypothetical protein PHY99_05925, partial [Bacteroidales bacterium]|nr:hypothetical protein [Bacteroidales bacterium]
SVLNPGLTPKQYLYYHICNPAGQIIKYGVYHIYNTKPILISKSGFEPGAVFHCSFNGETKVWEEKK